MLEVSWVVGILLNTTPEIVIFWDFLFFVQVVLLSRLCCEVLPSLPAAQEHPAHSLLCISVWQPLQFLAVLTGLSVGPVSVLCWCCLW